MSNVQVRGVNDRPEPLIVRRRGVSCPLVHVLSSSNSTMVNQEGNIEKREWRDGERELSGEGEDGRGVCVTFCLSRQSGAGMLSYRTPSLLQNYS